VDQNEKRVGEFLLFGEGDKKFGPFPSFDRCIAFVKTASTISSPGSASGVLSQGSKTKPDANLLVESPEISEADIGDGVVELQMAPALLGEKPMRKLATDGEEEGDDGLVEITTIDPLRDGVTPSTEGCDQLVPHADFFGTVLDSASYSRSGSCKFNIGLDFYKGEKAECDLLRSFDLSAESYLEEINRRICEEMRATVLDSKAKGKSCGAYGYRNSQVEFFRIDARGKGCQPFSRVKKLLSEREEGMAKLIADKEKMIRETLNKVSF
jgi:hypothetical protein